MLPAGTQGVLSAPLPFYVCVHHRTHSAARITFLEISYSPSVDGRNIQYSARQSVGRLVVLFVHFCVANVASRD